MEKGDQKAEKISKQGQIDAASRLSMEAELYMKKQEVKKAQECYN